MSILIQSFDPTDSTKLDVRGVGTITTNGHNQQEQLVLYNSSLVCFQITFLDKTTDIMPPSWAKSFTKQGPIGNVQYQPIFTLPAQAGAQPISTCYGVIYEQSEHIADLNVPLQYVYNVGNPGGIPVGTNSLTNTGNAPGVQVIKLASSANANDTLDVSNDGIWNAFVTVAGVLHQILKTQTTVPYVEFGQSGDLVRFLGDVGINGNLFGNAGLLVFGETTNQFTNGLVTNNGQFHSWKDTGGTNRGAIRGDGGNNTQIADLGGGRVYFTNNTGGQYAYIDSGGIHLSSGGFNYIQGPAISRDGGGDAVGCGAGTTISHGMGVSPGILVATPWGNQTFSATVGVGNTNGSTFQATVGAGSAIDWLSYA